MGWGEKTSSHVYCFGLMSYPIPGDTLVKGRVVTVTNVGVSRSIRQLF